MEKRYKGTRHSNLEKNWQDMGIGCPSLEVLKSMILGPTQVYQCLKVSNNKNQNSNPNRAWIINVP